MRIDGSEVVVGAADSALLLDFLRDGGAHSVKRSCEVQICGACSVLVDGLPVSSCCYLLRSCDDKDVTTVEGLRSTPTYQAIEDAFVAHAAVQCGFCTPGFVVTLWFLIEGSFVTPATSEEELRELLHGNVCRCTGYEPILTAARAAIERVAETRGEDQP
jgi:carbon-monoxide dehydrogenase small subunit